MRAILRALAVAAALVTAAPAADAFILWPFQRGYHHRGHHRGHARRAAPQPPPDCEQINEAVGTLEPGRLARAMRSTSKRQRAAIERCAAKTEPR